jgi:hypothetical protein
MGTVSNSSIQAQPGLGSFTSAAVGTTSSIALTAISSSASHLIPYITFGRIT